MPIGIAFLSGPGARGRMRRMRTLFASISLGCLLAIGASGCGAKKLLGPPEVKDVVTVTVDDSGFHPDKIPAKRGRPITLVFNRVTDQTCATSVVIASERITKPLPLNAQAYVTFIPEKAGDIHFACPMNMVTGTITVAQ